MDAISRVGSVRVPTRAVMASASAPAAPADAVALSGASAPDRAWLWTGLASAQLLGGAAVGGPLGAALSAQQKGAIREILGELHAGGVEFLQDRGRLAGVFGSRYQDRSPDEVMALIERGPAAFDARLATRRDGAQVEFRNLGTLQELDAFYGSGDAAALAHGADARALQNLERAGWTMRLDDAPGESRVDARGAWTALAGGRRLSLQRKDGASHGYLGKGAAAAIDYFEGSGDASGLANPALAARLEEVGARGFTLERDNYRDSGRGLWGAYLALESGQELVLRLGNLSLVPVKGKRPEDVDAALASAERLVELRDRVLEPDVKAGRLHPTFMGLILGALNHPVPGLDLQERAEMFQELCRAARSGPDKHRGLEQQTRNAYDTYERIRKSAKTGEEFRGQVTLAAGLLTQIGFAHLHKALKHLTETIPASTPFAEARREQEGLFLRLLRATGDVAHSVEGAEALATCLGDESVDARIASLERIARAGQFGTPAAAYRDMLASRLPGQSLEDATEAYSLLLGSLARSGVAAETPATWRFLQDGLRHGHFPDTDSKALVDRFLSALLLARDPAEARQRLLAPVTAPEEAGTIEDGGSSVSVGGIVLPKKDESDGRSRSRTRDGTGVASSAGA